jgi:cytochrome P450
VHLLSVKRVDSLRALRAEEVASLVARIRAASAMDMEDQSGSTRRGINVSELIVSLTYTVVSKAVFGNKLGGMDPKSLRAMMKEESDLLETVAVSDMFPRLQWVDWAMGLDASIKRTASKLDGVLERTLQAHENSSENNGEAGDLLDDLLSVVKKEGGEGFMLDRVDVKGLVLVSHKDFRANLYKQTFNDLYILI